MTKNVIDRQIQGLINTGQHNDLRPDLQRQNLELCIKPEADQTFWERVKIWSSQPNPIEWAAIGVGLMRDLEDEGRSFTMLLVEEFIDIPAYNLYRQRSVDFLVSDIEKITRHRLPLIMMHSHNNEKLEFSPQDTATAIIIDAAMGRPLIHIIVNSERQMKLLHLMACWNCPNSIFPNQSEREREGGE